MSKRCYTAKADSKPQGLFLKKGNWQTDFTCAFSWPCGLRDLSSPTRNWTGTLGSGKHGVLTTGIPSEFIYNCKWVRRAKKKISWKKNKVRWLTPATSRLIIKWQSSRWCGLGRKVLSWDWCLIFFHLEAPSLTQGLRGIKYCSFIYTFANKMFLKWKFLSLL